MNYKTYKPCSELKPFIKCYWTLLAPEEVKPQKQRIVPDGCMEMIFHCGSLFKQYLKGDNYLIQPRSFVFGQITEALDIEPLGETAIFSVRFLPDGFNAFATIPVGLMENRAVSLQELFGIDGIVLENKILQAETTERRIAIAEAFLLQKLITPESINQLIKSSVEMIVRLGGQLSVDELSENVQINRRQLERKFSAIIGLSPKQLSKIIRLQAALKLLSTQNTENLTTIAYESNYYDQAHFIKDFKDFTGVSPKQFYAHNLRMSTLFIDND
ncbi:helix-turn-helix transcriptional regulator [Emticicia sp. BO119]|uniref:helix-turn-helix transcriptional regulator n=1 Tax=Emticicia sp. BO119 TaxID=2757768 RepID=UPI0015F0264A|nr:helix-turn-helix transcriptional regulator [Emticicia sp. BO119]MBA4849317.1 helix-turn-helix transcriptional regulator [Emticicia sp. BO119]